MLIDGIHIPLTVPFTRDGEVYLRKLEHNVGRYSLTPASGLVALTADSEADALSDAETAEVLRVTGSSAAPEKVLVAGISKGSVKNALAVATMAEMAGFDAVLLSAPTGWARLTSAEVRWYFQTVADRSPLPVLLSSASGAHACQISVEMIGELARHPNIIGLYDSGLCVERYRAIADASRDVRRSVTVTPVFAPVTRRMQASGQENPGSAPGMISAGALAGGTAVAKVNAATTLKTRSKTVGFQVLAAGRADGLFDLLEAGAAGAMVAMSACAPQACHEVYAAFKDGNPALASEKSQRLAEADKLLSQAGIAGIKYGCDLNGYFGGAPRLPRFHLDAAAQSALERVLAAIRS